MSWIDRIQEAAYTSPSGQRVVFAYEDVSLEFDKNTAAYNFPDANGTYIQDLGKTGRRYPFTVIFHGSNCDLQATLFIAMLGETGDGKLEHPMYGTVTVVPCGTITRKDSLKSAANQALIDVTFFDTTGVVYPTSQGDAASEVKQALDAYNAAVAAEFAASIKLNTPSAKAGLMGDFTAAMNVAKNALAKVSEATASVKRQFTAIERSIVTNMDALIEDPLMLALQATLFVQAPAKTLFSRIESRFDAYKAIIAVITNTHESRGYGPRNSNAFKARDVFTSGAVSGQVHSSLNNTFATKDGAILAAESLLSQLDTVTNWRESNYKDLDEVDPGAAYTELQASVALAAGYLVEISFTLKQERVIYLDRARTIVDVVAELYGSVDDKLDFFITSNSLTGSEILELPRGRRIAYYL